jgi:hypothetical protein
VLFYCDSSVAGTRVVQGPILGGQTNGLLEGKISSFQATKRVFGACDDGGKQQSVMLAINDSPQFLVQEQAV